jgi:signal transduction histidine kinase
MSLGIRSRLTLAIVLITLAASTIVGVGLGRFTRSEFKQFLEVEEEMPVALPPTDILVGRLHSGDLAGARAELELMGGLADGGRLLLFAPGGELIGDTLPGGDAVLHDDGRLEVVGWREKNGERLEERLSMRGGIQLGEDGAPLGTLFVLPGRSEEREIELSPEVGFTRSISRAHLVGIIIATGLALVIALVLSGRIVGPVETLTEASRSLARGELGQRVEVRSTDEIGELSSAFNAMAESLERQEIVRRNMVSDIAHELRTPLTHLRCKLESVQDGLAPADEEMLSGLHGEILHLGRLVDDLQELALAEAGQLPMFPVATDLLPIAQQVVAAAATVGGGPPLALEGAEGLSPAMVDVDRYRQVLRNLVENALRHGAQDGGVLVRILAEGAGMIRCEVCDEGPGVAPEHLDRVFDRFHRTDPARGRATGGAGLGLAISRQLVLAWGGAIGVESEPGQGTRFWFTVPAA